jgi:hypothetical protein
MKLQEEQGAVVDAKPALAEWRFDRIRRGPSWPLTKYASLHRVLCVAVVALWRGRPCGFVRVEGRAP